MKVLVIDDDKIFTWMHSLVVKKCGLDTEPISFSSGQEALDYILNDTNSQGSYFILLDINMPEMNGWQFLERISNQPFASKLHVAMVTSSTAPEDRSKAKKFPQVIDYIEKPFSLESCKRIKELPLFN